MMSDVRRSSVAFQAARIHPVLVVGAVHVDGGGAIAAVACQIVLELLGELGGLFIIKNVFAAHAAGPLQGRAGGVVPDALDSPARPRECEAQPSLSRPLWLSVKRPSSPLPTLPGPQLATRDAAITRIAIEVQESIFHRTPPSGASFVPAC